MFAIMIGKGCNKMLTYNNSTYSRTNAYVGGDAYNYIINGTYATSFFVLAGSFLITGTIALVGGGLIQKNEETKSDKETNNKLDELPSL